MVTCERNIIMANQHRMSGVADRPKEERKEAENALDTAKEVGSAVLGKVGEAASWVREKAEGAASAVGHGIKAVGDTIKDKGPQSGPLGAAASAVGSAVSTGGAYLEEKGLSGIGQDMVDLVRRHPLPSILIGLGLGFMIARLTTSSNRS